MPGNNNTKPAKRKARPTSCQCILSKRDPDEMRSTMLHATFSAYLTTPNRYIKTSGTNDIENKLTSFTQPLSTSPTDNTENSSFSKLCILYGLQGSGKSTMLSHWIATLPPHLPKGSLIFNHHCRLSNEASQPIAICRRLASILKSKQKNQDKDHLRTASINFETEEDGATSIFRHLLVELGLLFPHIVLVFDDVEELWMIIQENQPQPNLNRDRNRNLFLQDQNNTNKHTERIQWIEQWIHEILPSNIRIILSTSDLATKTKMNTNMETDDYLALQMPILSTDDYCKICTQMLQSTIPKPKRNNDTKNVSLSAEDHQLLQAIIDTCTKTETDTESTETKSTEPSSIISPRSLQRTIAVIRAIGTDVIDEKLLSRLLQSTSTYDIFSIICSVWPLDEIGDKDDSRLEKLVVPEIVFAGAILVACALTENGGSGGNGLPPSDFVRVLRHMLKGGEVPIKISSKSILHLVRALGFQNKIGGHVGGIHSDLSTNEIQKIKNSTLEDYGSDLYEKLRYWRIQLNTSTNEYDNENENTKVIRSNNDDPWSTTWLDIHACIGHYIATKTKEETLVRCTIASHHLYQGESWLHLTNLLTEIKSFDLIWTSGWRSQSKLIRMWQHILEYSKHTSDTLRITSRLDPIFRYHESFTKAYSIAADETTDTDQTSAMDDIDLGKMLYNVADFCMAMGSVEKQIQLPEFVLPHVPRQHFEEWHQFVAGGGIEIGNNGQGNGKVVAGKRKKSRINMADTNKKGRKGGHKLYRRFVWSWFPLLAWNAPTEARRYVLEQKTEEEQRSKKMKKLQNLNEKENGTSNDNDNNNDRNKKNKNEEHRQDESAPMHEGIATERSIIEVMDGISRTPLTSLSEEKVRKTDAQVKAGARAESLMLNRNAMSPRTRKSNLQATNNGMLPSHADALLEVRREMEASSGRQRKEKGRGVRRRGLDAGGSSVLLSNIPELTELIAVPSLDIGIDAMVDQLFMTAGDGSGIEGGGSGFSLPGLPPFPTPSPATTRTPMMTPTSNNGSTLLPSLTPTYQMSPMVARHVDAHLQGLPLTEEEGKLAESKAVVAELR